MEISPAAQVALLLCGRLGKQAESDIKPLEPREFHRLATWLEGNRIRPEDVLTGLDLSAAPLAQSRLIALLERGSALGIATEMWTGRGLWVVSIWDDLYPPRLRRLGTSAPPILYGAGDASRLTPVGPVLAVVGSRNVDAPDLEYAGEVARACAEEGITVVSGGARGVDSTAMHASIDTGGHAIGVMADSLARSTSSRRYREALLSGSLVLISRYDPASGFHVGNAMGRNKDIYALSDAALVVATAKGTGGTWAGAVESLKKSIAPVFVRLEEPVPDGNLALLVEGAHAFPDRPWSALPRWLRSEQPDHSSSDQAVQPTLF